MENHSTSHFCNTCGSKVDPIKLFCGNCGAQIFAQRADETIPVINNTEISKRFCGHCGSPIQPAVNFCGNCGATLNQPRSPASSVSSQNKQPIRISSKRSAVWLGAGLITIAAVILLMGTLFRNGIGGSPSVEDIAGNSNFVHFGPNSIEIVYMAKCKLTDLDRARGYERKWWVEFRKTNDSSGFIYRDAWAFDGFEWDDYFATDATVGCPKSR